MKTFSCLIVLSASCMFLAGCGSAVKESRASKGSLAGNAQSAQDGHQTKSTKEPKLWIVPQPSEFTGY
jgi:uncharacterized protein YceK